MDASDELRILGLISAILDEDDCERRQYLADEILEIDPGNAVAKYVKWQSLDDPAIRMDTALLEEAVNSLRAEIESLSDPSDLSGKDIAMYSIYVSMLSDLAYFSYVNGDMDLAFETAAEFMRLDRNGGATARAVYYASLLERGEFEEVIRVIDDDIFETAPGEHCRAIAAFELHGCEKRAVGHLINAIAIDPDLPYFILGIWSVDEIDNLDDINDDLKDAILTIPLLTDLWSANEERLAFLSALAFVFGYITGRMEGPDDVKMIEKGYRDVGCFEEIQELRDILHAMLASGRDQEEVDRKALSMFVESNYFGLLD